jgi:hypothetical protein
MAGPASISLTRSETKPTALHFISEVSCSDVFTAHRCLINVHSRPSSENSSKAAISKDPHTEFNYETVGQDGNSRFQQTTACDCRILPLFFERHTDGGFRLRSPAASLKLSIRQSGGIKHSLGNILNDKGALDGVYGGYSIC